MSHERRQISRITPLRWAAVVTVVTVPGILIFFLPIVADDQLGDGKPAGWLEAGARAWLTCTAVVGLVAVMLGYWIPRVFRSAHRNEPASGDELSELGLLLTVWGTLGFLSIWTMLALDGDPPWLVWLTLAAALSGGTAQAHQLWSGSARGRTMSREQENAQRRKRSRR